MTPSLGIEPGPHWWEARALTTVTPLHSDVQKCFNDKLLPLPPSPFPTPKKRAMDLLVGLPGQFKSCSGHWPDLF